MPIYEYKCCNCKNITEELSKKVNPSAYLNKDCLVCKSKTDHKLIVSKNSFHLKGSCWAKDNYQK